MIIGNKEGTWTVLEELGRMKSGQRRFLLKCDCGAEVIKTKSDLKRFNKCKICSYKKYNFQKSGEFECIDCKGIFPLDQLKKSIKSFYCCYPCRRKREKDRIARRKESDKFFREKERIRVCILSSLRAKSFRKNSLAAKYLGCSKDEFIAHIESQFREGMSWDNRSEWHIDHLIPLSTAKTSEEIKLLWHYTNLQPLWSHENLSKGKRINWSLEEYLKKKGV